MPTEFLDTNVIIRYLTGDEPEMSRRALAFLQQVEKGTTTVTTCEGVLVEAVQVLSSKRLYNVPRERVAAALADVLALRGLRMPGKSVYLRALEIYGSSNVDFVDALCVAQMESQKIESIVTFDPDVRRVGVQWREP